MSKTVMLVTDTEYSSRCLTLRGRSNSRTTTVDSGYWAQNGTEHSHEQFWTEDPEDIRRLRKWFEAREAELVAAGYLKPERR